MTKIRPYFLSVLPLLHLCLCSAIALGFNKAVGGWTWFPVFLVDFPFSILLLPVLKSVSHPFIVFAIGGCLWWYFIAVLAAFIFKKALLVVHRRSAVRPLKQ